jgi:hypothetical protein
MTDLSGRVVILEASQVAMQQDLLRRLDLVGASAISANWNREFNTLEDQFTALRNQVSSLQSLYISLHTDHRALYTMVTGHFARYATGLNQSTHTGGFP